MTVFVDSKSVLFGKFPLPAILSVFILLSVLTYKLISKKTTTYSNNLDTFLIDKKPIFKIVGIIIIISSIFAEILFFDKSFSSNSFSLILFGLILFFYDNLPLPNSKYRPMILLFFGFFCLLYPLSTLVFRIIIDFSFLALNQDYTDEIVSFTLGIPLTNFLSLLGYEVWSSGDKIYYIDTTINRSAAVTIATGCSGIDSVIIFSSAFLSYIIVEYKSLNFVSSMLLLLGIICSYLANLLRMSIVILSGHYWGAEALQWTHQNVGWIIFTFWLFIFWKIIDYFLFFEDESLKSKNNI
tara:strand:+ start:22319 stop:23209 length:891 start_codon:yes stop_codon:yes gene_type:complete